jgi:RecB family exonuclease
MSTLDDIPVGQALTDFSPSRLVTAGKCGRAFEYQYVRKIPAPYDRGAMLLGDAVHNGVQAWYELLDNGFRHNDLAMSIHNQWPKLLPPAVWRKVSDMIDLNRECQAVAATIHFQRPELKSPTTTQAFLKSEAAKQFAQAKSDMLEFCDALDEVKWPKDEDPFKAYQKSMAWAANMQRRWQHLPRPLVVEGAFVVEFAGFRVRGRIDALRVDPLASTGEAIPTIVDYKTGRNALSQMEAFLQMFLYYKAIEGDPGLPTTDRVAFYLTRKDQYQQGIIDPKRHERLASQILNGRARQIAMGQFEPSFGFWCKSCDFNDICSKEISIWQGDDGLVAELMA